MKKLNLIMIFIALFLLDGIFLPGLFQFREGIIILVFLLAMILNWGLDDQVLWLGAGISFFLEILWKLQPGSLMILFLLAALAFFFISSTFNVKKYAGAAILSFILPAIAFSGGWASSNSLENIIMAFAGFLLCFFLFNKICLEKKNTKFL